MKKVVKGKGKWNIEKQIEEEILSWKKITDRDKLLVTVAETHFVKGFPRGSGILLF
jgi:hypothetical protein